MRRGTIALSWGPWGGFYLERGFCPRLCVGWVALTYCRFELDDALEAYARELEAASTIKVSLGTSYGAGEDVADFFNDIAEIDGSGYTRGGKS